MYHYRKRFPSGNVINWNCAPMLFNVLNHTQFSGYNATINYKSLTDHTITNLPFNANGTVNNINGFGTVNGARDPRILQLVVRVRF